jgi:hypothetical protein
MPRFRFLTPLLPVLAVLWCLAGATPALASHSQLDFFEAGSDLLKPSTQTKTFNQLKTLGVHALRIELYWGNVAPDSLSATKPKFEAANPLSYNWSEYTSALSEAKALGWPVLLTVTAPAPRWATSNHASPYITRPDDQDFKEFMEAVAREFGSEVSIYAIWNEPNHPAFLLPQWSSRGAPESPRIYRGLYEAGYEGLQAAGLSHPKILFGELAPVGYDKTTGLHDVAPLAFLRSALCLNASYRRSGTCSELQMTGISEHAYTKGVSPYWKNPVKDDVSVGTLSRLSAAIGKAAAAHAIPSHIPIYLTEFGIQSYPNHELGVPVAEQAEFDAISERIAWSNPDVAAFSQYLLQDDPLGGKPGASAHGGYIGFQTGLEYANGSPKPLYSAWPVPLTVTPAHGGYSLWGLVRPTTKSTKVTILIEKKGAKHFTTLTTATTNSLGYWTLNSHTKASYWRVRWKSPEGHTYEGPPIKAF